MPPRPQVAVVMGSDSDLPVMVRCLRVLEEYGVAYEAHVLSAHRSPIKTERFARLAERRGLRVLIAGAGGAAHLAGALAAHTTLPVIGVPIDSSPLSGLDALLSTVQMPPGVPVATVGVGAMGAANAGHLAAVLLAMSDAALKRRVQQQRQAMVADVAARSKELTRRIRELIAKA